MTEPQDPTAGHLDLETLADLDEGLLAPEAAEVARVHVAGCQQCQDDLAALASVRDLLAADAEIPMPDDLADRLHAALAAEPPLAPSAAKEQEAYAAPAVTTLPTHRPYDSHRRRNAVLAGLAFAAVIALFALGISVLPHGSSSTATSAAGTSAAAPAVVATTSSGRNYTRSGLGPEALPLVGYGAPASVSAAAASAAATSGAASSAGSSQAASAGAATVSAAAGASSAPASSAASSAAASSAASAPSLTGVGGGKSPANGDNFGTSAAATSSPAATPTGDVLAALRKPGAAQACLSSYEPRAGAPLAIDFATFEGKPAVIGVFQDPDHSDRLNVVAVGPPGCSLYEFARAVKP